jgi:hypothetical protein
MTITMTMTIVATVGRLMISYCSGGADLISGASAIIRRPTPRLEIRHRLLATSLASLNILKRLGGNENSFGSPLLDLASDGIMETPSYIRLLALLIFGNVFPSEFKGQIV